MKRLPYIAWVLFLTSSLVFYYVIEMTPEIAFNLPDQVLGLIVLIFVIAKFMVVLARLHDAGRSSRWALLLLVPVAAPVLVFALMFLPSKDTDTDKAPPQERIEPTMN
jgi:uncharacterized membrane protein YhaH (DUF805 family)